MWPGPWRQGDLLQKIDEALDRLYPGHTELTTDDLHGVGEFHTGGHAATRELTEHLELSAGLRVLDVGSGQMAARPAIWPGAHAPMSPAWT
ncbi:MULTISPECIES: hypothetical protein [Streptomyces]|uniref:Uncharacterized protein n=1 Tax=Streptomyces sp. 900129855 TaxID=3155129 RepID=A0ABV2ZHK6_9ACTN